MLSLPCENSPRRNCLLTYDVSAPDVSLRLQILAAFHGFRGDPWGAGFALHCLSLRLADELAKATDASVVSQLLTALVRDELASFCQFDSSPPPPPPARTIVKNIVSSMNRSDFKLV